MMTNTLKRVLTATAYLALLLVGCPVRAQELPGSDDIKAFHVILSADMEIQVAIVQATSSEDKERLKSELAAKRKQLPDELMALAEKYPETVGGLAALYWASFISSENGAAESATQLFIEQSARVDLEQLAAAISLGRGGNGEAGGSLEIAGVLLNRVKENPRHAKAAELLACVCRLSEGGYEQQHAPPIFTEAADLIVANHAGSPDITNFCELLGRGIGSPVWARPFERHLRIILEKNEHRHVRCVATFALASVIQSSPENRRADAAELYQRFLSEFDGKRAYHFQAVEQLYRDMASREVDELRFRGVGERADDIVGATLDGEFIKLSNYRGKVVLLSFWATWCGPCIAFLPHEKAIAQRFAEMPFAIVGVNGDLEVKTGRKGEAAHGISWPSFYDQLADGSRISDAWGVHDWPTMYLIDADGVIRGRWRENCSPAEIGDAIAKRLTTSRELPR